MVPQEQLSFPIELVIRIFTSLDCAALVRCRTISKQFKAIVDTVPELQYKIELHVAGFMDNSLYPGGVIERLRLLRQYQEARKRPVATLDSFNGPFPDRYYSISSLRQQEFWSELKCIHMRYGPDGPISREWTLAFDVSFVTYAIDAGQNLLVLVTPGPEEFTLRVCSLLEGSILKEILLPHLNVYNVRLWTLREYPSVHICGDGIGLVAWTRADDNHCASVTTMNWKTGVVMKPIQCIDVAGLSSLFVLLSSSCFLLGNIKENSNAIEVYSTEDEIATRDSDGAVLPVHIATYHLPPCRKGIWTFIYDSYWSFCSKLSHGIARMTPFEAAPSSAMLHISIYYRCPISEFYGCVAFHDLLIPRQVFANVSNIYKMQNVAEPVSHSWESWGPSSTRSIPEGWKIASMYGSRVLINQKHHLRTRRIMDFNQVDIARDLSNRKHPTAGGAISPSGSHLNLEVFSEHAELPDLGVIETEPTIVHDEVLFVDDVVTKLPFRWTKITEGVDWISAQYEWLNLSVYNALGL